MKSVEEERDDVQIRWFTPHIAEVIPARGEPLIVVSLYALWQKPNATTGSSRIYADASAHRLISDVASESIADRISVRALNGIEEWGKSDHARVVVEVGE